MEKIQKIVENQQRFYQSGVTRQLSVRISALKRLKTVLMKNEQQLTAALKVDLNKSAYETYASEIGIVLSEISFAIKHLKKWMKPVKVKTPLTHMGSKSMIHSVPYGSALIIGPWNYPIQLILAPLVGAIAAGNCAVLKPSELTPQTAQVISDLIEETFPPDYIAVVQGDADTTQSLLAEPFDYMFFTGSVPVGKIVMEAAAQTLTPVTLELGGKSPCIVHADADLDLAAKRIAWGKFMNAGQTCVAPDYLYVHQSVKESFLKKLIQATQSLYGQNALENSEYTHIVNEKHFKRLKGYLSEGKIVHGGHVDDSSLAIEPTILEKVDWADTVMQEEIFGPIFPLIEYETLAEVMEGISKNPNPLSLYLFTQNQKIEDTIVQSVSFGGGCINDTIFHIISPYLPFGGVGSSGMGSYHGKASFDTFSHQKSIMTQTTRFDNPYRYPTAKNGLQVLRRLLK